MQDLVDYGSMEASAAAARLALARINYVPPPPNLDRASLGEVPMYAGMRTAAQQATFDRPNPDAPYLWAGGLILFMLAWVALTRLADYGWERRQRALDGEAIEEAEAEAGPWRGRMLRSLKRIVETQRHAQLRQLRR
jgi:hypothetical protein